MSEPVLKPAPPQNPLLVLAARWRAEAEGVHTVVHCADELEKFVTEACRELPGSLAERVMLAVAGGFFHATEAQHLVAAVSCVAALDRSQDFRVRGELLALDKGMSKQSGGQLRVLDFSRLLTHEAALLMASKVQVNGARP